MYKQRSEAKKSLRRRRNADSETELYFDIVFLNGVESEVLERGIETVCFIFKATTTSIYVTPFETLIGKMRWKK